MADPTASDIQLPIGHKYALLSLPLTQIRDVVSANIGAGYVATAHLPVNVPEHWRGWVGSLQYEAIVGAGYYLIVHAEAREPDVLNNENHALRDKVLRFYTGLTIAVPNFGHEEIAYLTGTFHESGTDVREFTTYPWAFHVEGARPSSVTLGRLMAAKRIALAMNDFDESSSMERLPRMLSAFRTAHQSTALDTRLHQFVRVAEGFVLPRSRNKADEFARRIAYLIAGIELDDLKQLYTIRSTVEHLRGPEAALSGSRHEKRALLLLRTVQAEALARYLLGTFLDTPTLWPHFSTPRATQAFWAAVERRDQDVWPFKADLSAVTAEHKLPDNFWSTDLQ